MVRLLLPRQTSDGTSIDSRASVSVGLIFQNLAFQSVASRNEVVNTAVLLRLAEHHRPDSNSPFETGARFRLF